MTAYTWTGAAGDNSFNDAGNWSPSGGPPQSGDTAVINVAAPTDIILDGASVGGLTTNANTTLTVDNGQSFTFSGLSAGTFSNGGTLLLNSGGYGTDLNVSEATLTLTGGGQIVLSNNSNNAIQAGASGDVLNNVNNVISGGGSIGGGSLALVNGTAGIIDANQTTALVVNTGSSSVTNSGTLEATASATLDLDSVVNNGTSGQIIGNNGTVAIAGASITGGTLSSTGTGSIVDNGTATLASLTNAGTLTVQNSDTLDVAGTLTNKGVLQLQSGGYGTDLIVTSSAFTLTGSGSLTLSDNSNNYIGGAAAADKFVNAQKISGSGQFGSLTLLNAATGTISATGANALILASSVTATNNGLMQATGTGGLVLEDAVSQSAAGKILANGGNVYLTNASITGGTLASAGGAAIINNATGTITTLTNAGLLTVQQGNQLNAIGTITNTGTIALASAGYGTDFTVDSATLTLTGGGTVTMTDNGNNAINDAVAGETLVNVNNTIIGAGTIGGGTLSLTNAASGSIVALGNNALYLNTSGAVVTNAGLLEAEGAGGLWIETAVSNTGTGDIVANGGDVVIDGGSITAGTLVGTAGGVFVDNNTATLTNLTNAGTVMVQNGDALYVAGTLTNTGVVQLQSGGYGTAFVAGPTSGAVGTLTLTGGGQVTMTDNGNNYFAAGQAGDTLVDVNNVISGTGYFASGLVFVNDSVVNANNPNGGISFNGGTTITNNGLIEDTVAGNGGIGISTTISNALGTILASGGNVYMGSSSDIIGGTFTSANGGEGFITSTGTLDGSAGFTNLGTIAVNNGDALEVLGTITNEGTILLNSSGYGTELGADSTVVTLTGNGAVAMSNNGQNYFYAASSGATLINLNNTISGAGYFASGLTLVNDSTINANQTDSLSLNGGLVITNNSLIEATASGGLVINTTVANASGTISANGGNVTLQSADIQGGTLSATTGYSFTETSTGTLDGSASALTLQGTLGVNNGDALELVGQIINDGVLQLNSTGYGTALGVDGPTVTLTGGGAIALSDNSANYFYAVSSGNTLINLNNTIAGSGYFASGLVVVNDAVIDATGTNNQLSLNGGVSVTNLGLIESTGAAGLTINAVVNNAGGTIAAKGGNVYLGSDDIQGGVLAASAGGTFYETAQGTLDGTAKAVSLTGSFVVDNGQTLDLLGALHNNGVLALNSTGYSTGLYLGAGTVTVSGTGTILLSDNSNNVIYSSNGLLDLAGGAIDGAGNIGDGETALINAGLIEATGSNVLYIDTGMTGTNTATGRWVGEGAGGLQVENGTYSNAGTIEALNASSVSFASNATLTNDVAGTLTGGTYEALATTGAATVSITGSAVTTLLGSIILSGASSSISFGGATIDSSLLSIGAAGSLEIENSRVFTAANALLDKGVVDLSAGSLTDSAGLTITSTGTLLGHGNVTAAIGDAGLIDATGGKLTVTGAVSGTGQLQAASGAILDLKTAGTLTEAVSGAGTLELDATYAIAGQTDAMAVTFLSAPGTLSGYGAVTGAVTDNGLVRASGGTLAVSGAITGTGKLSALAGSTLKLSAGSSNFTYAVAGAGTLELAGAYTLAALPTTAALVIDAGASVTATGTLNPTVTDNGILTAGSGTLTLSRALASSNGTLQALSGAVLNMAGGAFNGSLLGPGTINVQNTLTISSGVTLGNGVLVTDSKSIGESAGATIGVAAGATLALNSVSAGGTVAVGLASDTLSNGGTVTAAGAGTVSENNALVNTGLISSTAQTLAFGGTFTNNGTVDAASGLVSIKTNVTGSGTLEIGAAGTLSVLTGAVNTQSTDFLSTSGGLLELTNAIHFLSPIAGFGGSDTIDLLNAQETSWSYANGILKVLDGTTPVASLHFSGTYVQQDFQVVNTNSSTVAITFV